MSTGCKLVPDRIGSGRITRGSYKLFFISRKKLQQQHTLGPCTPWRRNLFRRSETITWEGTQASQCHIGCRVCSRYWKHVDRGFWWFYRTEKRNRGKICRKLFSRCRGTSFSRDGTNGINNSSSCCNICGQLLLRHSQAKFPSNWILLGRQHL